MDHGSRMQMMSWGRFAAMIAVSATIMFGLMYQLVYEADHLYFSLNRFVASLVMACVMTIVMLAFMWPMYRGIGTKVAVLGVALVAGIGFLAINRSQALIGDSEFMESMIPHHSIAINNARKADLSDPRVRELANEIIAAQVREIAIMKRLLADIDSNGERGSRPLPPKEAKVTEAMRPEIEAAVR